MNNGWFVGLIHWEPKMPVFLHGLGPVVALEMETGWKMAVVDTKNFTLGCKRKFIFFLPSSPQAWVVSGEEVFQ